MEVGIFCNICGKVFSTKKKLKQHEAYHDETEVECGECQEKFIGKGALKNHERKHKTSICPHCSVVLSYQNKLTHSKVCSSNEEKIMYSCDQCDYKTPIKGTLYRHKKTHLQKKKFT